MINLLVPLLMLSINLDTYKVKTLENVSIGGVRIHTFRGNVASERAFFTYERLTVALFPDMVADDVYLKKSGNDYCIMVKDVSLITLTKEDAMFNKTDLHTYASNTLNYLKKVLPNLAPLR